MLPIQLLYTTGIYLGKIVNKQDCLAIEYLGQAIFCWKEQIISLNGPLALNKLFLIDNSLFLFKYLCVKLNGYFF